MKKVTLFLTIFLSALAVHAKSNFDLNQLIGKWHLYASKPHGRERLCIKDISVTYKVEDDAEILTQLKCHQRGGHIRSTFGKTRVDAKYGDPAKLETTFDLFFTYQWSRAKPHWILAAGEDNSYVVIGTPDKDYAWVLSKNPTLESSQISDVVEVLTENGYNPCDVVVNRTKNSDSNSKQSICEPQRYDTNFFAVNANQIRVEGRLGPVEVPLSARLLSISKYFDKSDLNDEIVMVLKIKYAKSSSHTKKYSYKKLYFPLKVGQLQEQGDTLFYVSEGQSSSVATHKGWYYPYWMTNKNVRIDPQLETKSGTLFTYIVDPILFIE